MLFKSSVDLLICVSISFSLIDLIYSTEEDTFSRRLKRDISDYTPKCSIQTNAVDQAHRYDTNRVVSTRRKRFVLFPEFINYKDDWRYLHRPTEFIYWIANFYPDRISTDVIHQYIISIVEQISFAIDQTIIVRQAADPGEANFHYNFFDYTKCPTDADSRATLDNVLVLDPLYIYLPNIAKENRYRGHGGIHLVEDNRPISTIKLNMQHTFLVADDLVYEPVVYSCEHDETLCKIDLYYVLLHETLHGFGIEHTTNAEQPTPPNPNMQAVMHFSAVRVLCHDDIRALRMIYHLPVERQNAQFDDVCRRDFPMNKLQRLMFLIGRILIIILIGFSVVSLVTFIVTLVYLLVNRRCERNFTRDQRQLSTTSRTTWSEKWNKQKKHHSANPRSYLWHDELL